jgi:hypothetical protein
VSILGGGGEYRRTGADRTAQEQMVEEIELQVTEELVAAGVG